MADKHPKRPRDLNQWAKNMVDLVTMDAKELSTLRKGLKAKKAKKKAQRPGKRASSPS
jgi:hypothetical protein